MVKDKKFYRALLIVALPAAFQALISMGVNMLDNLMVGSLEDLTFASVGLANQATLLFTFLVNGIGGGAAVLISQYWGKHDFARIRRIFGVILRFATILSVTVTVLVFCFPRQAMRIFTNDPDMIRVGAQYLRIVCLSYPLFAISNTMVVMLRWMEIVKIGLVISSISLGTNLCFNYLLIFGKFGFPCMGAEGAALATVLARLIELGIAAWYLFFKEKRVKFRLSNYFSRDREMAGDFFHYSIPIFLGESQWGLVGMVKSMMIGRLGVTMVSAHSIAEVFLSLALIFTNGLSSGACVAIGKSVGQKKYKQAREESNTIQILFACLSVMICGIVLCMSRFVPSFYNVSAKTQELAATFLVIGAFTHLGTAYHSSCFTGINRGAGDGKFVMKVDMICGWFIVIPLTFLAGFVFHAPLWVVYLCTRIDQCFKWIIAFFRLRGNKWMNNVTRPAA